jgi:hypothetical protein
MGVAAPDHPVKTPARKQRMRILMALNPQADMKAHERTYDSFLKLLKYAAVASFVLAFIVVLLISS